MALLGGGLLTGAHAGSLAGPAVTQAPNRFDLLEATVPQIQAAFGSRLLSAEELVNMYLARIAAYDKAGPKLNAFMTLNAQAAATAKAIDQSRFLPGHTVRPLEGIPVALKDIVDTTDMPTTGGAVALAGTYPSKDAFITAKLRAAGAVILGKLTLTEFANYVTNGMPGGYSSLGNFGFNPYDLRLQLDSNGNVLDGRPLLSPSGSSSGSGISTTANLVTLAIGTETSGSILSPSNANGIVGIKPTVGLVSRSGIIPITADQDTAGPMTRTVTDAAIMLGVIQGYDPADPATAACLDASKCFSDYTQFLDRNALQGARLAVPPFPSNRADLMNAAIAKLQAAGATVTLIPALAGTGSVPGILNYGQKRDVNAYLATRPSSLPIKNLGDLIAWNAAHADIALKYGQVQFIASNALDISPGSADTATYITNRDNGFALSRSIIDGTLNGPDGLKGTADDYDAVIYSGSGSAGTWARAGYPSVIVPLGQALSNGVYIPSGISFAGRAFGEARLIALAYAFEQLNVGGRVLPAVTPALASDTVLRGDINRDGVVNATDIGLLKRKVGQTATGPYDKFDIDGDGFITNADVAALTALCGGARGCR
jgi:amidase